MTSGAHVRAKAMRDQLEAIVRDHGPMTSKEIGWLYSQRPFADPQLLQRLNRLELEGRIQGDQMATGAHKIWMVTGPPETPIEDLEAAWAMRFPLESA